MEVKLVLTVVYVLLSSILLGRILQRVRSGRVGLEHFVGAMFIAIVGFASATMLLATSSYVPVISMVSENSTEIIMMSTNSPYALALATVSDAALVNAFLVYSKLKKKKELCFEI